MKLRCRRLNQGITLFEVALVIAILGFMAMLAPLITPSKRCSLRPTCDNNLKQLALAVKIWAGDHNDKYPMELSKAFGGTKELMDTPDAWKTFQVMSNELSAPIYIFCPQDPKHKYATNFDDSLTNGLSYFLAASATDSDPQLFLSSDDDLLLNGTPVKSGPLNMADSDILQWDTDRHGGVADQGWFKRLKKYGAGYIAFTDGSVQGTTDSSLTNFLHQSFPYSTNRLVIP
jgi:hypothetical protein